jgi:long-chain acyl-CoA synthetase
MPERTILDLYRRDTESPRLDHYVHWTPEGRQSWSTRELFTGTTGLAESLLELGVQRGDRVLLLCDNRPEWHLVDLAILDLGAVTVPVYGTLTADQIAYQAEDSGAVAAVVENALQMTKLLDLPRRCQALEHLIQIEGDRAEGVLSLNELIHAGTTRGAGGRFWERAAAIEPDDLMTIIYTSGTTGEPKGVMLTHDNMVSNVFAAAPRAPVQHADRALEFLPLCHVLERMVGYIYMWRSTARAYCSIYHVGDLIADISPTVFVGVPRFFEKVLDTILERVAEAPPVKRALFRWAVEVGKEAARCRLAGRELPRLLEARHDLADRLVLSTVREGLGGRVRFCLSGGAELPMPVGELFHAMGIPVIEGYGLTETSPVIAVNGSAPGALRLGTVGRALDNLEVRLADDGELLVRGPSVMKGYWNKPDDTAAVFDDEGFFHTGDIADIDDDGFVLIVDRKKDLIVTAGGKNIAPQPIESHLEGSALVDTAVLIGDGRPFVVALISPAFDELDRWAAEHGLDPGNYEELVIHPKVRLLYSELVDGENASLARYEQIKKFRLLPITLSIEGGHLTPTLKVKRRVIEQQFERHIRTMYAEGPPQ